MRSYNGAISAMRKRGIALSEDVLVMVLALLNAIAP
jgi:hypothetical protein